MQRTLYARCSCGQSIADTYNNEKEKGYAKRAVDSAVARHKKECSGKVEFFDREFVDPTL